MPRPPILIRGSGIAACCCARLLQQQGCFAVVAEAKRAKLPAILLSESTQRLLADVFQTTAPINRFPKIRKRIVAWGGADPVVFPHSAVVASEDALLESLWPHVGQRDGGTLPDPAWTIITVTPASDLPAQMHFGSRTAFVREVELTEHAERDACWVESVENGWLFLLASGNGKGSLISVGGQTEQLLQQSRLIEPQMHALDDTFLEFPAYPRILSSLCGNGWLACGTAAVSFDPLCGEGTGNAVREAILASAAVQALLAGQEAKDILAEYSLRLMLGFLRHLKQCHAFYRGGCSTTFWSSELALLEQGIAWTKKHFSGAPDPRFRLIGFGLERIKP
jgi:2-polyprenyl-6-methoxyphenol hydroxylase-like FAD-dependent oxidoreductase